MTIDSREDESVCLRWYLPARPPAKVGMLGFSVSIPKGEFERVGERIISCTITYSEVTAQLVAIKERGGIE